MELTGEKTMRSTIELALKELVAAKRRQALIERIRNGDFSMTLEDLDRLRSTEAVSDR